MPLLHPYRFDSRDVTVGMGMEHEFSSSARWGMPCVAEVFPRSETHELNFVEKKQYVRVETSSMGMIHGFG